MYNRFDALLSDVKQMRELQLSHIVFEALIKIIFALVLGSYLQSDPSKVILSIC
jgi:hypothetical protein